MVNMQQEYALAVHLRACGHFLYYQTGGKTGQRRILMSLLRLESLTQRELQDALDISSGALSEILQKMEAADLVARQKSAHDKRQVRLSLTPKGREKALGLKAHYTCTLGRMFECLGTEEKAQLGAILEKLVAHLDALKADPLFLAETEGVLGNAHCCPNEKMKFGGPGCLACKEEYK